MDKILIHCPNFFNIPEGLVEQLSKRYNVIYTKNSEEAAENIVDADILMAIKVKPENIKNAKNLKWIQSFSSGVDKFPLDLIEEKGIVLTNARGIHRIQMSEFIIFAMIFLARNFKNVMQNQNNLIWDSLITQDEIYGKTVGILGIGSIGKELAKRAKTFGMKVVGIKKYPEEIEAVDKVYSPFNIEKVFAQSDFVVNLLPSTPDTRNLINIKLFHKMKKGSYFINMGRGDTVVEEDLISALNNGQIKRAFVDVFANEPLGPNSPLWGIETLTISSHLAGSSPMYIRRLFELFSENLMRYETGDKLINIIDNKKTY